MPGRTSKSNMSKREGLKRSKVTAHEAMSSGVTTANSSPGPGPFDHKAHMSRVLSRLLSTINTKIISETKFNKIVRHLQQPETKTEPPKLKWWIRRKGVRLLNLPDMELADVLVIPKPGMTANASLCNSQFVVHSGKLYNVVSRLHSSTSSHHLGYKKVLNIIEHDYYGIPRSYVQEFCRSCPVCKRNPLPELELAAAQPKAPVTIMDQIHFRTMDMIHSPDGEFKYIGLVLDQFSKFHILFPLKTSSASEIAAMIEERVLGYFGAPFTFHSNNSQEDLEEALKSLFDRWGGYTLCTHGMPGQSQASDEIDNRLHLLEAKLDIMKEEFSASNSSVSSGNYFPWSSCLPQLMFMLNTEATETSDKTPYEIVFRQKARNDTPLDDTIERVNEEDGPNTVATSSCSNDEEIAEEVVDATPSLVTACDVPVVTDTVTIG